MRFDAIKESEQKNIAHTYGRVNVAIEGGKGAVAYDADGKKYIDFTSGIGVNCLGYSDEKWVKAVAEQAGRVQHISNYYYSPVNVELAEKLTSAANMAKVFFCNSGAEANECAIKAARKYGEAKGADVIITLENSFHGRTLTTLAATGQDSFHTDFSPLTPGFIYAPANDFERIEKMADSSVCAIMIETIQGEGGVLPLDEEYIKGIRDLCDERDILLIIDEVQTGIGRTGTFFSYNGYGVVPDIVTSAKGLGGGLPIAACLLGNKLAEIFSPGMNGSTYGGNPVACAGAIEVIERIDNPKFLREVAEKGEYIKEKLLKSPNIEFVRGKGLMIGVKVANKTAAEVVAKCVQNGLLILTAKDIVRFLPPLNITKEEIDEGIKIFMEVVSTQ